MPIPNPTLTEEEKAAIGRHLEKHAITCPACRSTDVGCTDSLFGLVRAPAAPLDIIQQQLVVVVSCATCGYVMLFYPRTIGLDRVYG